MKILRNIINNIATINIANINIATHGDDNILSRDQKESKLKSTFPYLGSIFLQTGTKLKKSLKNILNCCKLQIVFKNKTRLGNNFHFKDRIPKDLPSGVVYKFWVWTLQWVLLWWMLRHLNVRIGEHIGISPLTKKQVKPKNSYVADHLLFCNHSASYEDFSILTRKNKKNSL